MSDSSLNVVKRCRYGPMMFNIHDAFIGGALDVYGEWCHAEIELLGQLLRPGDTVIDVGANIGTHTIAFAQAVGPAGEVWAFEPQRVVFQMLCGNVALNGLMNVHTLQLAIGARAGHIAVPAQNYAAPGNFGALTLREDPLAAGERVPLVRLDDLAFAQCRLIKIDVEGMETAVLAGATETIRRHRPFLYLENDRLEKSADLLRALDGLGYHVYGHVAPYFNPDNFNGERTNMFVYTDDAGQPAPMLASNVLAVPKEVPVDTGSEPLTIPS